MTEFGSDATHLLPSRRQSTTLLKQIARSIVPSRADFCFIHLAHGEQLRCVANAHATPRGQRLVSQLGRMCRILRTDPQSTVAHVVRSGRPQLRSEIAVDESSDLPPHIAHVHRQLGPRSAVVVPLLFGGHVVGALTLGYAGSNRRYAAHHVATVMRLARRITRSLTAAHVTPPPAKPLGRGTSSSSRRLPLRARA
jgi:GAF domain-containing protein